MLSIPASNILLHCRPSRIIKTLLKHVSVALCLWFTIVVPTCLRVCKLEIGGMLCLNVQNDLSVYSSNLIGWAVLLNEWCF